MTHTYVIAKTNVECLQMSRVQLNRRGKGYALSRLKEEIDIPSNEVLFQHFLAGALKFHRWIYFNNTWIYDIKCKVHVYCVTSNAWCCSREVGEV